MRLKRTIASVMTAVCLFTCFGITASAETVSAFSIANSLSPLYDIAQRAYSELDIVGSAATCISEASGDNTVKITAEQTLQRYSGWFWIWDDVDSASWTKTVNENSIFLVNTKSDLGGGTYRLKSVFTLTDKNGKTETITVYSDEQKVV